MLPEPCPLVVGSQLFVRLPERDEVIILSKSAVLWFKRIHKEAEIWQVYGKDTEM